MNNVLNRLKEKQNKKGFTLVEIIVEKIGIIYTICRS